MISGVMKSDLGRLRLHEVDCACSIQHVDCWVWCSMLSAKVVETAMFRVRIFLCQRPSALSLAVSTLVVMHHVSGLCGVTWFLRRTSVAKAAIVLPWSAARCADGPSNSHTMSNFLRKSDRCISG